MAHWQSNPTAAGWGRIEATVKAACLSVPAWLLWGLHHLAAYLDFHSSHLYGYGQSKMRQYPPMCNSLVACLDGDQSTWSRSLVKDDYWRTLVPLLNSSSRHVRTSKLLRVALRRDKVMRKFRASARRHCSALWNTVWKYSQVAHCSKWNDAKWRELAHESVCKLCTHEKWSVSLVKCSVS